MKAGDPDAARQLWERYIARITALARRKLAGNPRRMADEDDVAQSVFRDLFEGATAGAFPDLIDRNDLWPLLARMTHHKSVKQIRWNNRQKRGGGDVRGESAMMDAGEESDDRGFDRLSADTPPPELSAELAEECKRLIESLPDDTYRFVIWKRLEGLTNGEIAKLLQVSPRSVERKVKLTREMLVKRLAE